MVFTKRTLDLERSRQDKDLQSARVSFNYDVFVWVLLCITYVLQKKAVEEEIIENEQEQQKKYGTKVVYGDVVQVQACAFALMTILIK